MRCPKCGFDGPDPNECIRCGVIFAKLKDSQPVAGGEEQPTPEVEEGDLQQDTWIDPPTEALRAAKAASLGEDSFEETPLADSDLYLSSHESFLDATDEPGGVEVGQPGGLADPGPVPEPDFCQKIGESQPATPPEPLEPRPPETPFPPIRRRAEEPKIIAGRRVEPAPDNPVSDVLGYPLRGNGPWILAGGTLCLCLIYLINLLIGILGFVISLMLFGYLTSYLFQVVRTSSMGHSTAPDWAAFDVDAVIPVLTVIAVGIGCFLPVLLTVYLGLGAPLLIVAVLFGLFYYPMAFLAVVTFGTLAALDPRLVLRSIAAIPKPYLLTYCALVGVVLFSLILRIVVGRVPVAGIVISSLIRFYGILVICYMLGRLHRENREALNWF